MSPAAVASPAPTGAASLAGRTFEAVVAGLGGVVLAGWALDVPERKSILSGLVTVKADTALAFVLAGAALVLTSGPSGGWRLLGLVADLSAGLPALLGLLALAEYLTGRDLWIDQLLFIEPATAVETSPPGRMAVPTVVNFFFLGLALLGLGTTRFRAVRMMGGSWAIVNVPPPADRPSRGKPR